MFQLLLQVIKNTAYESAKGTLVIGTATANLIDADAQTLLYMVLSGIIFNFLKEVAKLKADKK